MRKLPIGQLSPGMVLGKTLYNNRGDILLQGGVVLSARHIAALRQRSFYAVYVRDGIADDVVPHDVVSARVRAAARRHLHQLFNIAQQVRPRVGDGERPGNGPAPPQARLLVEHLYRDVESIVDEVLNAETLDGVASLKSHENYSFEHSIEVTVAGVLLGKRLHLPLEDLRQLALGCVLHDIGKLLVPPAILAQARPLAAEEMAAVQRHPEAGYAMVTGLIPAYVVVAKQVVWQHHERQDGSGYPRGLSGSNDVAPPSRRRYRRGHMIFAAEIAAVADVYSALASDRPYRMAMEPPAVVKVLGEMAGRHLNREIVKRFLAILPAYPVGMEVMVSSGRLEGYRGIVTAVNPAAMDRPTVRILIDPRGAEVLPFEVDAGAEQNMELASAPRF